MRFLPCRCRSRIHPGCLSGGEHSGSAPVNSTADSDIHPLARCHDGQVGMSNGEITEAGPLQTTCPVNTRDQRQTTSISNRTGLRKLDLASIPGTGLDCNLRRAWYEMSTLCTAP